MWLAHHTGAPLTAQNATALDAASFLPGLLAALRRLSGVPDWSAPGRAAAFLPALHTGIELWGWSTDLLWPPSPWGCGLVQELQHSATSWTHPLLQTQLCLGAIPYGHAGQRAELLSSHPSRQQGQTSSAACPTLLTPCFAGWQSHMGPGDDNAHSSGKRPHLHVRHAWHPVFLLSPAGVK